MLLPQPQTDGIGIGAVEFMLGDDLLGFVLGLVQLADAGQHQMGAGRITLLGLVKVPPAVDPAADLDDGAVAEQVIVDVERVGIEITAVAFVFEEGVDAGGRMVAAEIEDVEGVVAIAVVNPHLPGQRSAGRQVGIEIGHLGGVGVQHLGQPRQLGHEVDHRAEHAGHVGHPRAHGRARQLDAVAAEDAFQAVQRQMVGVLAGHDLR